MNRQLLLITYLFGFLAIGVLCLPLATMFGLMETITTDKQFITLIVLGFWFFGWFAFFEARAINPKSHYQTMRKRKMAVNAIMLILTLSALLLVIALYWS